MMIRSVSIAAPSFGGGGMVRACFLAELLRHLELDVEIVAHLPDEADVYPVPPADVSLSTVCGRRIWQYARRYADRLSGDVVIAVKPRTSSFGAALLSGVRRNRPLVLDLDDWESRSRAGGLREQVKVALLEHLTGLADAVTVNNRYLQRRFGGVLIPSGRNGRLFDPARFDPIECRRLLGLQDRFVLMFPGTVVPHSGLEDLLAAMTILGRQEPILVVVGGRRSGAEYLRGRLARWSPAIVHLPRLAPAQVPGVAAAAHLFVVPHRDVPTARYNFPMKLVDGMAMGKPILATRVGDIPLAVGDAGYLVEPASPEAISHALARAMDEPAELERLGRRARWRFEQAYSLDAIAPAMEQMLAGLPRKRGRRSVQAGPP